MFINASISCWMFMVHCRIEFDEFWVKIAKSAPQTRRNSLLAHVAISDILCPANMLLACWLNAGSVVRFEDFLSSFYNFITPKQHLSNAHNIK
jgi:hypothetical protein